MLFRSAPTCCCRCSRAALLQREAAQARLGQAVISYRKTILNALGEVANGSVAYETSDDLMAKQATRVAASREAMRTAELRFRAGTANFLEVLDAQRQLLAAETEEAQALLRPGAGEHLSRAGRGMGGTVVPGIPG